MKDKPCNEQSYTLTNMSFFKTPKLHSSLLVFFFGVGVWAGVRKSVSRICRRGKELYRPGIIYTFSKNNPTVPKGRDYCHGMTPSIWYPSLLTLHLPFSKLCPAVLHLHAVQLAGCFEWMHLPHELHLDELEKLLDAGQDGWA